MMYEPWIDTLDVSEVPPEELEEDPDRPFDLSGKESPTTMERAGIFSITTLQNQTRCLRGTFADYLQDDSPNGSSSLFSYSLFLKTSLALHFTAPFCCDRCHDFKFHQYFLGDIYTGQEPEPTKIKIPAPFKKRVMNQRVPLQILIKSWRTEAHKTDPLRVIRRASWIIDDAKVKELSAILPTRIRIPSDIADLLGETDEWSSEWSQQIFDIIQQYDNPPAILRSPPRTVSNTRSVVRDEPPPQTH